MTPIEQRLSLGSLELTYFEWCASKRAAGTVLLAHATGFHARCWDQVVRHLPGRHVIAVDQRGHGRTPGSLPVHWAEFGRDLAAFVRLLDLHSVTGVGHSMGGHAMTEAAALEAQRFTRLLLIDPVIVPPEYYNTPGTWTGRLEGQHPTAKRRAQWESPTQMYERFRNRAPFDTWDPTVLRDYCHFGLLPDGDGYRLACHPEYEAKIYMTSRGNGAIYERVRAVRIPVRVVRAMQPPPDRSIMDFRYSPTWRGLATAFAHGRDFYLPERTHFLPMEDPGFTADLIRDLSPDPPSAALFANAHVRTGE